MDNTYSSRAKLFIIHDRKKLIRFLKNGTYQIMHVAQGTRNGKELYIPHLIDTLNDRTVTCVFPLPKDCDVNLVSNTYDDKEVKMLETSAMGEGMGDYIEDIREIQSFLCDDLARMKEAQVTQLGGSKSYRELGGVIKMKPFMKKDAEGKLNAVILPCEEGQVHSFKFGMTYFIEEPGEDKKVKDCVFGVTCSAYFPQYTEPRRSSKKRKIE